MKKMQNEEGRMKNLKKESVVRITAISGQRSEVSAE